MFDRYCSLLISRTPHKIVAAYPKVLMKYITQHFDVARISPYYKAGDSIYYLLIIWHNLLRFAIV